MGLQTIKGNSGQKTLILFQFIFWSLQMFDFSFYMFGEDLKVHLNFKSLKSNLSKKWEIPNVSAKLNWMKYTFRCFYFSR
jgi:hypothetical protein